MPRRNLAVPLLAALVLLAQAVTVSRASPPRSWPIEYRLDEDGQVSLAVYDQGGRLARELLRGASQKRGPHRVDWDGLDRDGRPLPPGEYTWKLLQTPGFRAEYVTSLGTNPDSASFDPWVGNHGGPASVAVDRTGMYVAAQITETAPVLLKQSLDGTRRLWTRSRGDVTEGRYQGGISLASDGQGTLYMLQQNGRLQVIDAEQGRLRASWNVLPPADDDEASPAVREWLRYHHGDEIAPADLDAWGEILVLSDRKGNTVRWLSPKDGTAVAEVKLPSPSGVAVGSEGEVFVISQDKVLKVTPDGQKRVLVDADLVSPRRLAVDRASGDLLVAERDPGHQVKRFSRNGELLATYGRAGGRRQGTYQAGDFLDVTDITADGRGGFLVAELTPAPRRVAHFDRDGRLLDQWYGGQPYYAWAEPDPRDPRHVWFNPGGWLALAEVDYDRGSWRLLETYHLDTMTDGLVRSMPGHRGRWQVLYHEGQRFLVSQSTPQVLAHRPGELTAVTVLGGPKDVARAAELAGRGSAAGTFRWVDANGDGRPQTAEFTFNADPAIPDADWLADDFAALETGNREQGGQVLFTILQTVPQWRSGAPIYPIGDESGLRQEVASTVCPDRTGSRGSGAYRDARGRYYGHFNAGPERHGRTWPTHWGGVTRFVQWDAEGRLRWKVGRHAIHGGLGDAPGSTPAGRLHVPVHVIGETREAVILADRVETPAMAWTTDGLYAGSFFDRRTEDGLPERAYSWWRTPDGTEAITASDNAKGP